MPTSPAPADASSDAFLDPDLPVERRIEALVSALTLPEKVSQLLHDSPAIDRVGVPAYNWWNEACHGIGRSGRATVFPQVIGLGATWDRDLVLEVATAISDEARAKHNAALAAGSRGQYQGLTFWTPNINIFRDPRWGRGQETFGEDPYLTGELGTAMVAGLQGDNPRYLKTAACAKHFAVHSGPERDRHTFDACPSEKDFAETYLPAFEKLVHFGVEAVMGAYNRTLGEVCCGSRRLLVDILRDKWGFKGHVVSDCGAVDDFHLHHKVTKTGPESAALAIRNGCDLNCGNTFRNLVAAVEQGLLTEEEIDASLRHVLATKLKLGLFDPQDRVPWSGTPASVIDCDRHRALARRAAAESIVLLKNNGVLPLRKNHASILVAGPTSASVPVLLGNYYGASSRLVTIIEGIVERTDEGCRVVYREGCPIWGEPAPGVNYTFSTAEESEITIAVLGLDPSLEGEEGDAVISPTGGDREAIELPEVQLNFLKQLRKSARKLILVLTGGSAIAVPEAHEICDAVLQVWYPGCEGGRAVADVLFGDASPAGRMPVTVPMKTLDLPAFTDYAMKGRTYRFAEIEPLYPFGFGLGYAKIAYGPLEKSNPTIAKDGIVTLRARVTNSSAINAHETVQCYIEPPHTWPDAPRATLVEFTKVQVPAGGSVDVEFELDGGAFAQIDASGASVHVPGTYGIVVGPASPGRRATELGAPPPATGEIDLI